MEFPGSPLAFPRPPSDLPRLPLVFPTLPSVFPWASLGSPWYFLGGLPRLPWAERERGRERGRGREGAGERGMVAGVQNSYLPFLQTPGFFYKLGCPKVKSSASNLISNSKARTHSPSTGRSRFVWSRVAATGWTIHPGKPLAGSLCNCAAAGLSSLQFVISRLVCDT